MAAAGCIRNAIGAGAVATALLVVLALPLTSLKTGPVSPELLPKDDPARVAYDKISAVMGPGFTTPFNIVVVSKDEPITDRAMLRKLDAFQEEIAGDPRVKSVVGPGDLYATTADLKKLPKQLKSSKKMLKTAPAGLERLEEGLGTAGSGSAQLQSGIASAAAGAQSDRIGLRPGVLRLGPASRRSRGRPGGCGEDLRGPRRRARGRQEAPGGSGAARGRHLRRALRCEADLRRTRTGRLEGQARRAGRARAMAGDVAASAASVNNAAASAKSTGAQINDAAAQLRDERDRRRLPGAGDARAGEQQRGGDVGLDRRGGGQARRGDGGLGSRRRPARAAFRRPRAALRRLTGAVLRHRAAQGGRCAAARAGRATWWQASASSTPAAER